MNQWLLVSRLSKCISLLLYFCFGWTPMIHAQYPVAQTNWRLDSLSQELQFSKDSIFLLRQNRRVAAGQYSQKVDTLQLDSLVASTLVISRRTHAVVRRNGMELTLIPLAGSTATPKARSLTWQLKLPPGTSPYDWSYLDIETDSVPGSSLYKALQLVKNRSTKPVIVGVIDTGMDENHPLLKSKLWRNKSEIPGNGIDDDRNGYVDDNHGWFWLRLSDSSWLTNDQVEATRILSESESTAIDPAVQAAAQALYTKQMRQFDRLLLAMSDTSRLNSSLKKFSSSLPASGFNIDQLRALSVSNETDRIIKEFVIFFYRPTTVTWNAFTTRLLSNISRYRQLVQEQVSYSYSKTYKPLGSPPKHFVGSGLPPADVDAVSHGTFVGGILISPLQESANQNEISPLTLMDLGVGPSSGDERDEFMAQAIRYAVVKGASVINISMAKLLSARKKLVDEALLYAQQHDVLIINCAGNESANTDSVMYYPVASLSNGKQLTSFLEVGNSSQFWNRNLAFYSSNYGPKTVDLFAPGTQIRTTSPNSSFSSPTGTSVSAPLVARVAALLRSYFPYLSAPQIKKILCESVTKPPFLVNKPGTTELVAFDRLCSSGGILNAYKAFTLALAQDAKHTPAKVHR